MAEKKKQTKQNSNKSKSSKQLKNKEPVKKSKVSSLVVGSIIMLIVSVVLTMTFPYIKNNLTSINTTTSTTTSTPVVNENIEKETSVVESQQIDNEYHPKLIITSNNNGEVHYEFKCTFEINETTKELVKRFPLSMNMVDLNGTEKYHTLKESLPVRIQPVDKVRYGDILLFQSRYLAVFYDTFDPVKQYSIIGKIDNPELLREAVGTGSITASFVPDEIQN